MKSRTAFENLERICEERLPGRCHIQVVDLLKNPRSAKDDQIVAVPTVVRKAPPFSKRVIGDMSNADRVISGLDLTGRKPGWI